MTKYSILLYDNWVWSLPFFCILLTDIQKAYHFEPERIYITGKREGNSNSDRHLTDQVSPILTIIWNYECIYMYNTNASQEAIA